MSLAVDLLYQGVRIRADTLALVLVVAMAGVLTRGYLRRQRSAGDFAAGNWFLVVGVAIAGALLAEYTTWVLGYPAPATLTAVGIGRAISLTASAAVVCLLLANEARFAVLRSELRSHATNERELELAKAAADHANRAKSDFLAVMSHEIRTPLNAVMGFANLLAETKLDETQRGYLHTITSEGARLGSLINDVLDLSKIEEGRLVLERLPFAPAETAHEILRLLGARALEKKIDLRIEAQLAGPLLVAGDPLRFRQVLLNLVDNAVKFTPRGSVTVFLKWAEPASPATSGRLTLRVVDTGIGIAEERVKDLFQMFTQMDTSTTRRYGGTGLGLAICQRLVTLMGGEITVTSKRGEGSEFSFSLPMQQVAVPTSAEGTGSEPPLDRPDKPRVLVVDDMETNRFLLEVFLRRNGFEPELAGGGDEAVRLAASHIYDVILMDLQMPDVDGYEATRRIRAAEPSGRHTIIVALTASVTKGTRDKCLAAGMDEHLTKPLDLKKFKSLLHAIVAHGGTVAATR